MTKKQREADNRRIARLVAKHLRKTSDSDLAPYALGGLRLVHRLLDATDQIQDIAPKNCVFEVTVTPTNAKAVLELACARWLIRVVEKQLIVGRKEPCIYCGKYRCKCCCDNGKFGQKHDCQKQPANQA